MEEKLIPFTPADQWNIDKIFAGMTSEPASSSSRCQNLTRPEGTGSKVVSGDADGGGLWALCWRNSNMMLEPAAFSHSGPEPPLCGSTG